MLINSVLLDVILIMESAVSIKKGGSRINLVTLTVASLALVLNIIYAISEAAAGKAAE